MKLLRDKILITISDLSPGHDSPIKQLSRAPLSIPVTVPLYEIDGYVPVITPYAVLNGSDPVVAEIDRQVRSYRSHMRKLILLGGLVSLPAIYTLSVVVPELFSRRSTAETFKALDEKASESAPEVFFPRDNFPENQLHYFEVYGRKKGMSPSPDLEFQFAKAGSVSIVILGNEIVGVMVDGQGAIPEDEFRNYEYLVRDLLD